MKIGCQIGVWPGKVLDIIRDMGAAGIEGVELFDIQIAREYGYESEIKKLLAENNIQLCGAYFGIEKFISPEDKADTVSRALAAAAFLNKVGSSFLIIDGSIPKNQKPEGFNDDDFKQMGETMNRIGVAVKAHSVVACVHPHVGGAIESPKDLDRLLEYLDTSLVGLCLHANHQVQAGFDPYEMYEKHANLVRYLHIGEIDADNKGELLGEGVLDQKRLMKPLLDAGYDGWIIIESRKEGVSPKDYVLHAKRYIKKELLCQEKSSLQ